MRCPPVSDSSSLLFPTVSPASPPLARSLAAAATSSVIFLPSGALVYAWPPQNLILLDVVSETWRVGLPHLALPACLFVWAPGRWDATSRRPHPPTRMTCPLADDPCLCYLTWKASFSSPDSLLPLEFWR